MVKGCSNSVIQCTLFAFNFIFVALGSTIFGVGVYILTKTKGWSEIVESPGTPGVIVVITGGCIFLVAFFGCFGALKENECLLKLYCIIVTLIAFLQIAGAIFCLLYRTKVDEIIGKEVVKTFDNFNHEQGYENKNNFFVELVQWEFKCCGVKQGPSYWTHVHKDLQNGQVPGSCCREPDLTSKVSSISLCSRNEAFTKSCDEEIRRTLNISLTLLACATIVSALIQFIAGCFACVLAAAV